MKIGIVVLGHGSRAVVDEANEVLLRLSDMIKANIGFQLMETAFMNPESGRPGLDEAVGKLVENGAEKIVVAPVFISNGIHMQKDIPAMIEQLMVKYGVAIKCAAHMGADSKIAEIVSDRIREVV